MKSKKRKIFFIVMAIVILGIIGVTSYPMFQKLMLYRYVDNDNYQVKFILEQSFFGDGSLEVTLYSDGKCTYYRYGSESSDKNIEGYLDKEEIKEFVRYAIGKNITEMPDNMSDKSFSDGYCTYVEFKFGKKTYRVGGYMAEYANKDYYDILVKLSALVDKMLENQ